MKKVFTSLLPLMFLIIFSWRLNAQLVTISLGRYFDLSSFKLADGYFLDDSLLNPPAWGTKIEISYRVINKNFSIVYETGVYRLSYEVKKINNPYSFENSYERTEFTNYLGFEYRPKINENWTSRLRASIGSHSLIALYAEKYFSDHNHRDVISPVIFAFKLQTLVQFKTSAKTAFSFGPHYSYRYDDDRILKHTNAWGAALQFDILID